MADSIFNPQLQKVGFQGYVAPPIVNKGKALGAEALFNLAGNLMDTAGTYQKEKALKGVAENVGDIIREQQDRSLQGQENLAQETQATQAQIGQIQKEEGYDSTYPTMLNQTLTDRTKDLQNNLAEKTDKLARAKEQGIMQESEFRDRFNKVIQDAIAANPSYADDIMAHAKKVADIHDISYKVKQDMETVKNIREAEEKRFDKMMTAFKEGGVAIESNKYILPNGQKNIELMRKDYDKLTEQKQYNAAVEYSVKNNEAIGKINAQAAVDKGLHYQLIDGRLFDLDQKLNDIAKQNLDPKEAQRLIQQEVDNNISDTYKFFSINQLRSAEITEAKDFLKARATLIQEQYNKIVTNAIDKEVAQNRLASLKADREYRLYESNPELIDLKIMSEAAGELAPRLGYEVVNKIESQILQILRDTTASYSDEGKQRKNDNKFKPVTEVSSKVPPVYVLDKVLIKYNEGETDVAKVEDQFTKILNYIDTENPKHGAQAVRDLINTVGNPTSKQAIDNMSPETMSRISTMIGEYTKPLSKAYQDFVETYPNAELKILPDSGKIIINNLTPEFKQFNSNGLRSINEAFKAYHAVSGNTSVAKSADEFYNFIKQQPPTDTGGEPTSQKP